MVATGVRPENPGDGSPPTGASTPRDRHGERPLCPKVAQLPVRCTARHPGDSPMVGEHELLGAVRRGGEELALAKEYLRRSPRPGGPLVSIAFGCKAESTPEGFMSLGRAPSGRVSLTKSARRC